MCVFVLVAGLRMEHKTEYKERRGDAGKANRAADLDPLQAGLDDGQQSGLGEGARDAEFHQVVTGGEGGEIALVEVVGLQDSMIHRRVSSGCYWRQLVLMVLMVLVMVVVVVQQEPTKQGN